MGYTFTVSSLEKLHKDFKKVVYARGSNVSEAIVEYMQSEVDGIDKEFNDLKESFDKLSDRVQALEGEAPKEEEWHG